MLDREDRTPGRATKRLILSGGTVLFVVRSALPALSLLLIGCAGLRGGDPGSGGILLAPVDSVGVALDSTIVPATTEAGTNVVKSRRGRSGWSRPQPVRPVEEPDVPEAPSVVDPLPTTPANPDVTIGLAPGERSRLASEARRSLEELEGRITPLRSADLEAAEQRQLETIEGLLAAARKAFDRGDVSAAQALAQKARVLVADLVRG